VSIHKRPDSKRSPWRVSYRDADGRQRSKSFATHREAIAFDAQIKTLRPAERIPVASDAPDFLADLKPTDGMLLADWLREWFTNYGHLWSVRTTAQRSSMAVKWITPLLGKVPVADINERMLKRYRHEMLTRGATNNTANAAMSVLSAALTAAREDGLIGHNPARGQRRLPHQRKLIRPLTPLEVEAIRYAMPTPRDKIIVSLIAYAGLRPAEVCGLTWAHIRPDVILVEQSVQQGMIVPTKTRKARTVRILQCLADDLAAYGRGADDAFVVAGDRGGPLNWNIWGQRVWRAAVPDKSVTPYHLRHTFASLALHEGRSLPWIAGEMGHASATTLLDHYAHLYQEAELATRVPMEDAVRAARSTTATSRRSASAPAG
jgi:integrase